jgi:hypothetical protein
MAQKFLKRFADNCFSGASSDYTTIKAVPLKDTFVPTREMEYSDIVPHLSGVTPISLNNWTYVPYNPPPMEVLPYIRTAGEPKLTNTSGQPISGIKHIAIYGVSGSTNELMWVHTFDELIALDDTDSIKVTGGIRFYLETE